MNRRAFLGTAAVLASGTALAAGRKKEVIEDIRLPGKTRNTKFAVNIEMWWRKLPFLDRIREAAKLGFPAIEFWPCEGKDVDAIAKLTRELEIHVSQFSAWGFQPGLNSTTDHAEFVAAIEDACEAAKRLNCKKMTVVGGDDVDGMTQEQMHANIITGLKKVAPICEKNDVMIILEPMNIRVDHIGHCLYGSPPAIRICKEVGSSHVKLNWDLYHMQIMEGDLCGRMREGFEYIGYLQFADHPGRHEPGTGEISYARVFKEAHDLGYDYFMGVECVPAKDEYTAACRLFRADIW
jgi:hydroxypyruvate isomerase